MLHLGMKKYKVQFIVVDYFLEKESITRYSPHPLCIKDLFLNRLNEFGICFFMNLFEEQILKPICKAEKE